MIINTCFMPALGLIFLTGAPAFSNGLDYGAEEANTTFLMDIEEPGGKEDYNYPPL